MLSIQAYNHLMSPASRDTERPFKAYTRPPVTLSSASLYPTYTQTFPAPSLSLHPDSRRRAEHQGYPFSAMDFRHHHHGYDPSIMDISNATPGNGRLSSMEGIKSEMDAMTCASGMSQGSHGLSQGAHGFPPMSMGHSDMGSHSHHIMGGSNGTEPGPSKVPESNSGPASVSTSSSLASASGDSPPLSSDHMSHHASSSSSAGNSKIPPKKRPLQVPDNLKDTSYWEKRKKNNESAKRSREARRMKEEQIAMRVVYLEQENLQLRTEVSLLKSEIEKLRCMLYNS